MARSRPVILVTGAGGLLGPYLAQAAARRGRVVATGRNSGEIQGDLTDAAVAQAVVSEAGPDVVLHAAALTDVDECERNPTSADRANRLATENLVAAVPAACRLVYLSTDQVYPDCLGLHRERDVDPVNAYGRSKLAGEMAVLRVPGALALRTNIFGPSRTKGRRSLSDFVLDALEKQEPLTLFRDVYFSPLHMETLAEVVFEALAAGLEGVFNVGSRDGMSKLAFGLAVAEHAALSTALAKEGDSTSLPSRAPRPRDLRLDVAKLEVALGREMPTLAEEIARL